MIQHEVVTHWQKGARDSLQLAKAAYSFESYSLALFHCQLSIEKALKGLYVEQHDTAPPKSHDLPYLTSLIQHSLSLEDVALLNEINEFCVAARYDDPQWAEAHATPERAQQILEETDRILSVLLP